MADGHKQKKITSFSSLLISTEV